MNSRNLWIRRIKEHGARLALLLPFLAAAVFLGQYAGIGSGASALLALPCWIALAWLLPLRRAGLVVLLTILLATAGYFAHRPSNERDWSPEVSRPPSVKVDGDILQVENLRDFEWRSATIFEERWQTASYDLTDLEILDVIVVPFGDSDSLAHVMLSFGFKDGRRLAVSVESRPEKGETYGLVAGAARQLELIYLFGAERDLLGLRILHRGDRMYAFPLKADPVFARGLLLELCHAANQLRDQPKFYATLRHNCTTTLLRHANKLMPEPIAFQKELLFPGKLGALLHRLDLIDTELDWPAAKEHFRVDQNIRNATDISQFSKVLRAGRGKALPSQITEPR